MRPAKIKRTQKRASGKMDANEPQVIDKLEEDQALEKESSLRTETCESPARLRVGASGVEQTYYEDSPKLSLDLHFFHHPVSDHSSMPPTSLWFNATLTALGATLGGLWSFNPPSYIVAFSHRESIPCDVLVLLDLLSDSAVPSWRSPPDETEKEEEFEKHQRFLKGAREVHRELRFPPEQAREARMIRMQEEAAQFQRETIRSQMRQEGLAEREMRDALASPKLSVQVVGEAARRWLVKNTEVDDEVGITIRGIVEDTLYNMIASQELARNVAGMLERWRSWTESGGMAKSNHEEVKEGLKEFCFAACMLAVIRETSVHPAGSVVSDLQEVLRMWRKVRLG